jgi:hypothetical protein
LRVFERDPATLRFSMYVPKVAAWSLLRDSDVDVDVGVETIVIV